MTIILNDHSDQHDPRFQS